MSNVNILLPQKVTFAVFTREIPPATTIIKRDGKVEEKPLRDYNVYAWLEGDDDTIDVTPEQVQAVKRIIMRSLETNPCVEIIFKAAASPWSHP